MSVVKTSNGGAAGPYSTFQVRAELIYVSTDATGYNMKVRAYISVSGGTNGFQGTNVSTSWTGTVALYNTGTYADVTSGQFHVNFGSTYTSSSFSAQYTAGSGTTYKSTAGAMSYTVPRPTYTVTYNANGGENAPANQTKTYGTTLVLSSTIPTRTGYTFLGWSTSSSAPTATWKAGGSYTDNKAADLYAVWMENEYVITLDPNGGTISRPTVHVFFDHEENKELSTLPIRPGCKFLGFYTSTENDAIQVYDETGMCTNEGTYWKNDDYVYADNLTLYAHWEILNVAYYKNDKLYILCNTYGKVNGSWQPMLCYAKIAGIWKQSITQQ